MNTLLPISCRSLPGRLAIVMLSTIVPVRAQTAGELVFDVVSNRGEL